MTPFPPFSLLVCALDIESTPKPVVFSARDTGQLGATSHFVGELEAAQKAAKATPNRTNQKVARGMFKQRGQGPRETPRWVWLDVTIVASSVWETMAPWKKWLPHTYELMDSDHFACRRFWGFPVLAEVNRAEVPSLSYVRGCPRLHMFRSRPGIDGCRSAGVSFQISVQTYPGVK